MMEFAHCSRPILIELSPKEETIRFCLDKNKKHEGSHRTYHRDRVLSYTDGDRKVDPDGNVLERYDHVPVRDTTQEEELNEFEEDEVSEADYLKPREGFSFKGKVTQPKVENEIWGRLEELVKKMPTDEVLFPGASDDDTVDKAFNEVLNRLHKLSNRSL